MVAASARIVFFIGIQFGFRAQIYENLASDEFNLLSYGLNVFYTKGLSCGNACITFELHIWVKK